jgi:DNA repair protein RadD
MEFNNLLSRADDETLQTLLGSAALRLIMLLDRTLATPTRLRELLLGLRGPEGLLLDPNSRTLLLDLLRDGEARTLAQAIGIGSDGDVYAKLRQSRFPRGSEKERVLFGFFELYPPAIDERIIPDNTQECSVDYPLFEHQRRAANEVASYLSREPRRVLLHMPTGSGKTRTSMNVIADHLRSNESTLVVWLAHTEELCEQAAEEFARAWRSLGNRDIKLRRFWGSHSLDLQGVSDGIVIAGLSKVYSTIRRDNGIDFISALGRRCTLVVMDEAHQAVAETYKLILSALFVMGERTSILGLTATPGRTWSDINADQSLADFFARQKVTLSVPGYDNPLDYLVSEGYIARVTFRPLLANSGLRITGADLRRIEEELDIPIRVLERLGENDQRNLRIVQEVEDLVRRHRRIILFAASVQHSKTIACALRARGIQAYSLTGATPSAERARIIEDFKDDSLETKVLCNYGVLTTGFDAPSTSAAVIARPTLSLVLYSQMVGRAIRGHRAGGNAAAEIVTIVDQELPGFGAVAQAFRNWEDVWRTQ